MQRDTARAAVVAALCILALAVAAATLDTAQSSGRGGGIGGDAPPGATNESGEEFEFGLLPPRNGTANATDGGPLVGRGVVCNAIWREPAVLAGIAGLVAGGFVYLTYRHDWVIAAGVYAAFSFPLFLIGTAIYRSFAGCPERSLTLDPGTLRLPAGGGGAGGEVTAPAAPTEPPAVLLVVLAGLIAAVAVLAAATDDDVAGPDEPDGDGAAPDVEAVGRTAGAAADRIEGDADPANEVYRAWREMTTHLEVANPGASTPLEFREAAVEAGMAPEHVDELTELFEAVRYGGYEATRERERRALEALRRIEAAYADGGGEG